MPFRYLSVVFNWIFTPSSVSRSFVNGKTNLSDLSFAVIVHRLRCLNFHILCRFVQSFFFGVKFHTLLTHRRSILAGGFWNIAARGILHTTWVQERHDASHRFSSRMEKANTNKIHCLWCCWPVAIPLTHRPWSFLHRWGKSHWSRTLVAKFIVSADRKESILTVHEDSLQLLFYNLFAWKAFREFEQFSHINLHNEFL